MTFDIELNKKYYHYDAQRKTIHSVKIINYVSDDEIHVFDEYLRLDEQPEIILTKEDLFERSHDALEHVRIVEKEIIDKHLTYTGETIEDLLLFAMVQDHNNIVILETIRQRCVDLGLNTQKLMTYHYDF